jgi:S1-C subfamily serine protease
VSPLTVAPVTTAPVRPRTLPVPASVLAARVDPSVVDIDTKLLYQHAIAAGTGMVLTSSGLVLTNNHVIDGATTIQGVSVSSGRTYSAHVVGVDPGDDVAIIQLEGASGLATVTTRSTVVNPGDPVVAIGNAGGVGGAPSVTSGTVEAVDQSIVASDPGAGTSEQLDGLIETSANLQPGDSGGPLVNGAGEVIGMDTAASVGSDSSMVSFAIPVDKALAIAHQIEIGVAGNGVYLGLPPFLGIQVTPGTVAGRSGALVAALLSGGPAAGAGVTAGSLIIAVNGEPIESPNSLAQVLRQFAPGNTVSLAWLDRLGASHSARVTLASGPAD